MENWKGVVGFPGYEISDQGNARSLDRQGTDGRQLKGVDLKQAFDGHYKFIGLRRNGKTHVIRIHRLVATAFCKNPNNENVVHHMDGIKTNNEAINLEWVSQQENVKESQVLGLVPVSAKQVEIKAKRTAKSDQFDKIVELLQTTTLTQKQIATEVGINHSLVSRTNSGKRNHKDYLVYPLRMTGHKRGVIIREMLKDGVQPIDIQTALGVAHKTIYDIQMYDDGGRR